MGKYLVYLLVIINILASIIYFVNKDNPRGMFWLSAGMLNAMTLFMK